MNIQRKSQLEIVARAKKAISMGLVTLIRVYQKCISPALGPRCRFYPSCSEYCISALQKYGLFRGSFKSIIRVCKCQPMHKGGIDLP